MLNGCETSNVRKRTGLSIDEQHECRIEAKHRFICNRLAPLQVAAQMQIQGSKFPRQEAECTH